MKYIHNRRAFFYALALTSLAAIPQAGAQDRSDWSGTPGVESAYNQGDSGGGQGTNWSTNFQPDATFSIGEYASISNGGIAVIDASVAPFSTTITPADIRLGEDGGSTGSLVIRSGGSITVAASGSGSGELANGVAGSGTLVLRDDLGAVSLTEYSQNNASTLVTELSSGSSFATPVNVSGSINLNGTLRVDPTPGSGFTLTAGDTWTVFSGAPVSGQFSSIDVNPALRSNPGQSVAVSTSGNAVTLSVEQRLVLEVDRYTGSTTLRNPAGHTTDIEVINYTLSSPQNGVSSSNGRWNSFEDDGAKAGWFETNPTSTNLSELNPLGSLTLNSGDAHEFGTPVNANTSAPLGVTRVDTNDVSFSYQLSDGTFLDAIVEPVGRFNDLVLVVDPVTGNATMQNQASQPIEFISYTIQSTSGSLETGFAGLEGQSLADWSKGNPTATALSELNPTGSVIVAVGDTLDLGVTWDFAAGDRDLTFNYQTTNGALLAGTVHYGDLEFIDSENADFNSDGDVDGSDFLAWQRGFGTGTTLASGDANNDMAVDGADLSIWQSQYSVGSSLQAATMAVPEPTCAAMVLLGLTLLGQVRCRGAK